MVYTAQAAIAEKAEKEAASKATFVDDETKAKLKEAAEKAQEIAKDLAETSVDVAKSGLEALKAGVEAATKTYKETRKN